ncbi:carboxypeptidase-like regulatory domain-containing protein [uncultured Gimesia sp.]|uniref:carboxypeptidase-like regulatory domain-containing protein n=1 Tax=uncultured Gimesia sp. TaxID=1678688 RepID=UPI0030D77A48|tara:strand:+ start:174925 stop:175395 length:471 start_codon:yes stop_codon:yes gene_type:complete
MHNLFMMNQPKQVFMSGLVLATLCLVGCGGGSTLPEGDTGTVTGKVTFNGKPVSEGASIVFLHKDKGITASSAIAADGSYALRMRREDAILVGDYQIGVTPPTVELTPAEAEAVNTGKELPEKEWPEIPKKYRNPETSGVTFTVKAGENTFDLDMK